MNLSEYFPPPGELETMPPEIIAPLLLKALFPNPDENITRQPPEIYHGSQPVHNYVPDDPPQRLRVGRLLNEAWAWLIREGLMIPDISQSSGFYILSIRGKEMLKSDDFTSYKLGTLLPVDRLEPGLARKVRTLFLDGDYDTAVFNAYKEVETRVRTAAGLPRELIGTDLMRAAFKSGTGPLSDATRLIPEQEALAHMFAGAIGFYKNPSSHRDIDFDDPIEAAEAIIFANHLLRIVNRVSKTAASGSKSTR